jgi:hypothetical protein
VSEDGATQGVSAGDALNVILRGESEDDQVHARPDEFAATIRTAVGPPWEYGVPDEGKMSDGYTACANWLARQILEWLEGDLTRGLGPVEDSIEWGKTPSGQIDWSTHTVTAKGWSTLMKEAGFFPDGMYGCTGFQWGWACNAARTILDMPPVSNPAIMTIGGVDD